jgi:hypothetical protein
MRKRLALTLALSAVLAASSKAQESAPKLTPNAQKIHWKKYINKEFGFSLRYPDSYQPSTKLEYCKDNDYRKYLLCLVRRDDPDARILVMVIVQGPFRIKTNRGDIEYAPQKIGQHLFYCGVQGSMGTGFSDECTFNLRDKTLEISYSPTLNSGVEINPLMLKSLKTFRTF